ncbi:YjcZ family sporulation protein [Bacillus haimaensis]
MSWCGCGNYGYGQVAGAGYPGGYGSSFVLIVVLFILLIIVGAAWC